MRLYTSSAAYLLLVLCSISSMLSRGKAVGSSTQT